MNISIYVATHKRDNHLLKLKDFPIYKPIHCGKDIYSEDDSIGYLPELGDNTGDNISSKNHNYCELTAIYWAWKNDTSSDIIGLNHYRRYFKEPTSEKSNELLTKDTIIRLLDEYDFLVDGSSTFINDTENVEETIYDNYKSAHNYKDMDNALLAIKDKFPDIYDGMKYYIMNTGAMCLCNLFITKREYFNNYCNFLFTILSEVESKIDFNDPYYQGYNGRALGFLAERLFRPWLKSNNYSGFQLGEIDWEKYSGYKWR